MNDKTDKPDKTNETEEVSGIPVVSKPIPKTLAELRSGKQVWIPSVKTAMRPHYDALYDDEGDKGDKFRRLLTGVTNSESVEGTMRLDDAFAANMIRERAREIGDTFIAKQNAETLMTRLRTLMADDGIGRKARREAGEADSDNSDVD